MEATLEKVELEQDFLRNNFGSTKGKIRKVFDPEVKERIAEELALDIHKQKELFRKVGL